MNDEAATPAELMPEQPNYAKGLAWTMGFNAIMKVAVGLAAIYYARVLPLSVMGIFGVLGNIYIFTEQMREAGLRQAYYNDPDVSPIRYRTYARLSVVSGITFGSILAALSYPLSRFFGHPEFLWSILWVAYATCVNGFSVVSMASLQKSGRFRDVGIIETMSNLVAVGVSLTLVLLGWGLEALIAQLAVRSTVLFALAFYYKPYSVGNIDKAAAKQILRTCTPLVATDVLWLFYSLADQFTLLRLVNAQGNAFYAQGKKLLSIPTDFVFHPLFRTVAVAIGNRSADAVDLARTFMKAISLSVVTLGAIFGVSAALAKPLVLVVYGEKYAGAIPIFGIICLGEAFKLTGGFAGSALVAAGKSKIPLYAWLVPYPIMAGGIALAWNHISLTNIALSYMIGMVTVNVIVIICAFVNLKVDRAQVAKFWAALGCVALITGIAYGISLLPLSPLPHFLLALAIIPPIYAGIIGTVLARNPLAFISRSGPTRLREAL